MVLCWTAAWHSVVSMNLPVTLVDLGHAFASFSILGAISGAVRLLLFSVRSLCDLNYIRGYWLTCNVKHFHGILDTIGISNFRLSRPLIRHGKHTMIGCDWDFSVSSMLIPFGADAQLGDTGYGFGFYSFRTLLQFVDFVAISKYEGRSVVHL